MTPETKFNPVARCDAPPQKSVDIGSAAAGCSKATDMASSKYSFRLITMWESFQDLTFGEIREVVDAADKAAQEKAENIRWGKCRKTKGPQRMIAVGLAHPRRTA